ncbi:MAG: hypothetical protein ABJB73_12190, partial [Candidatus Nitrosocosmicus sp.]
MNYDQASNIYFRFIEKNKDRQFKESEFESQVNDIIEIIKDKMGLLNSYFSNTKINTKLNLDQIFFDLTKDQPRSGRPPLISEKKMLKIKQEITENPSGWQVKQVMNIIYK